MTLLPARNAANPFAESNPLITETQEGIQRFTVSEHQIAERACEQLDVTPWEQDTG